MSDFVTVSYPVQLPVQRRGEAWMARSGDKRLRLSNLDKIYWPDEGFTKGDLLGYYLNVSQVMLPHLVERPLTMKRMPDGVAGPFFYEKNAPSHTPEWIQRITIPSGDGKSIDYVSVSDVADMLWVANLGCIEFHPLHARGPDQRNPDYAFFDLDPFEPAGYAEVRHVAALVKVVLDRLELRSYPKTSGATGMQIMVPLDRSVGYDMVRGFVGAVSELVHAADPDTTTLEWEVRNRTGKVFLDVNMNRAGANIAAAYSVRPEPGATASAPFGWDELDDIDPKRFTIETMMQRIEDVGDPFLPVAEGPPQGINDAIEALDAEPRKARVIRGS